jgi:hypothetical protein
MGMILTYKMVPGLMTTPSSWNRSAHEWNGSHSLSYALTELKSPLFPSPMVLERATTQYLEPLTLSTAVANPLASK